MIERILEQLSLLLFKPPTAHFCPADMLLESKLEIGRKIFYFLTKKILFLILSFFSATLLKQTSSKRQKTFH